MAKIGRKLRNARAEKGLSQQQVGDEIGVSQTMISLWENDRMVPSSLHLELLDSVLGTMFAGATTENAPNEPSQYGSWVQRVRIEKEMSVQDLATRSGVSMPAIYNIESGRTPNPRKETRTKLSKALGVKAPALVIEATEAQSEIVGLGSFLDFDPHNDSDLPTEAGVYVFYDVSERPINVGESDNIRRRVRDHTDKFWFKRPIVETASYVTIAERDLRRKVEQILIRFLKSNAVLNKQHVER